MDPAQPTPPKKKRLPMPTLVKLFLAILILGAGVSMYIFTERLLPTIQHMRAMREEADSFRAMRKDVAAARVNPDIGWPEILEGKGRGQIVRLRGQVGPNYQLTEGAAGGTIFFFPPDAPSVEEGPRALLYFSEIDPPQPDTIVEAVAYISTFDPQDAVLSISPEQFDKLESSIPRAVMFSHPLRVIQAAPAPAAEGNGEAESKALNVEEEAAAPPDEPGDK